MYEDARLLSDVLIVDIKILILVYYYNVMVMAELLPAAAGFCVALVSFTPPSSALDVNASSRAGRRTDASILNEYPRSLLYSLFTLSVLRLARLYPPFDLKQILFAKSATSLVL